ncbi:MAG: pilus assembly protein PilA [Thermoproteus sp.]
MRKLKGQAGGIDALIIIAVVIAVAAIIALAMMRMGQSASANTRAQVIATVGGNIMTVEVQVLNGKLNALYLQYWQQGGTPSGLTSGTCYYNGTSGMTSSSSSSLQLYTGQSAVCYFNMTLSYGVQYSYVIYGVDSSGRTIQLARGIFTAGAT